MKKLLFCLLIISISLSVHSQDTLQQRKKWQFLVEPYLMLPNMSGTTGLGNLPDVDVKANPGDIFNHLQMGAMLSVEAYHGKWAVGTDMIYMSLKQDANPGLVINNGKVSMKQFAWELTGLYRVSPWLEVGAGTLLTSLKANVDVQVNNIGGGTTARSKGNSKTWVDPMIIARVRNQPGSAFIYSVRGEIGGFGIGSQFTWQVQAYAGYRFSKLFQLTGGYRVIGIDYDKGSGDNRFLYDMNTFGPVIRLGFNL